MLWLDSVITAGIQRLLILRLKNPPANDTVGLLVDTWVCVFKDQPIEWNEALDTPRIQQAFLSCAGKVEEFPAPRTVLQYLPSRPEVLKLPDLKPRTAMPASIKAAFNLAIQRTETLNPEQRRTLLDRDKEELDRLIRQMKR
jgi:hypothetical protein